MSKCLLKPLENGSWYCVVCKVLTPKGKTYKIPPTRPCPAVGELFDESKPDKKDAEKQFVNKIEEKLNGRILDEALLYFEICKGCSKYRVTHCARDRGCDKEQVFIARLARGYCKERWGESAKNSTAYKFILTSELVQKSYELIKAIPHDVDVIAGAARSGLLPATAISAHLHLPLLSVGKEKSVATGNGWRLHNADPQPKKILLIDDTVYSGRSLSIVKDILQSEYPHIEILTAAIFVHPKSIQKVDYYVEQLPGRHYLEWNFFNSIAISRCVFDFDGILCEDIPGKDDDDGERYFKALENAIPKYLVRREPIPIIVTARLEKYRAVTEAWLKRYGVSCKKLIMGPWENNKQRAEKGSISRFKAGIYKAYSFTLFVESDPLQAAEIVDITGKEVLCPRLRRVLVK